MANSCEVCENFRSKDDLGGLRVVEVDFPERSVRLCTGHAKIATNSGVKSFDELRELYGSGRRSYVPRRGTAQPPSEAAPRSRGRRATD